MIILVLPEHNEVDYNSNVDSLSHFERNIFKQFLGGEASSLYLLTLIQFE